MPVWIAWVIAGISTAGLVALWFVTAHRELLQAKRSVENSIRQISLHKDGYAEIYEGPYKGAATHSLNVSRTIYCEAVKNYEAVRYKPVNRLPAFLLGYRAIQHVDAK